MSHEQTEEQGEQRGTDGRKTLLLVEDERIVALGEKKTLERHGYQVVLVFTGEEAVETVDRTPEVDLVLMDIDLGSDIDGTDAARRILEKHDLPIVFLSGRTDTDTVEKTEGITSYGFIDKSSGPAVLSAAVKMAFRLFEAKQNEHAKRKELEHIEWMLSPGRGRPPAPEALDCETAGSGAGTAGASGDSRRAEEHARMPGSECAQSADIARDPAPPYGDLTELNDCRVILDGVGKETLSRIVHEPLALLETSAAIYERNGDYAFGIFSSAWCRFMDAVSRERCGAEDNREALRCGKWICHESCWEEAARPAMERNTPIDIPCQGGINLYAVPIKAGGETIGAISVGYGDPPRDPERLRELAERYGVSAEELAERAKAYPSRPHFIVELAKQRIHSQAQLIGEIVERTQTAEKLREQETRYRSLFESSPISLWEEDFSQVKARMEELKAAGIRDFEGFLRANPEVVKELASIIRVIDVNEATLRQYSARSKEEFLAGITTVFSEESFEGFMEAPIAVAEGRTELYVEKRHRTLDGRPLDVQVHWAVVSGHEETYSRVLVSVVDVSERKRTEQALARAEENWRSTLKHAPLLVVSLGREANITFVNDCLLELTGWTEGELLGRNWIDTSIPEDEREYVREVFGALASGERGREHWHHENAILTKGGARRWVWWANVPTLNTQDGPDQVTSLGVDLTERREREERITKLLREKELVLRESHHRIKNNMELIRSLLSIRADEQSEPCRSVLEDMADKARSMMLLYTKLYQTEYSFELDLREWLPGFIEEIVAAGRGEERIEQEVKIDRVIVPAKKLAPLGLIVGELITNSIKHGFAGRATGRIRLWAGPAAESSENAARLGVESAGAEPAIAESVGPNPGEADEIPPESAMADSGLPEEVPAESAMADPTEHGEIPPKPATGAMLVYEDDGRGLPERLRLGSAEGRSAEGGTGFGIQLVEELVAQIGGTIRTEAPGRAERLGDRESGGPRQTREVRKAGETRGAREDREPGGGPGVRVVLEFPL